LTQRYLVGVPPEATGVATQTPRGTTGILMSALQRVQLGGQPAYESRPLLPLQSQLQPHRFHNGRAAMRLRNRGPLSGTASSKRPTEARLALIQSPCSHLAGGAPPPAGSFSSAQYSHLTNLLPFAPLAGHLLLDNSGQMLLGAATQATSNIEFVQVAVPPKA